MKLSIVTVCYNNLPGLQKTIDSLRTQKNFDFEHWVIDGASKDGTAAYLEELKVPWSLKWISEKDRGIYDAMNKGLQRCTGDYIWFLNSADICYDADTISIFLSTIEEHSSCDIIYGQALVQNPFGYEIRGYRVTEKDFQIGMPVSHQAILYKAPAIQNRGYSTEFRIISDWILTRDVFRDNSAFYLERPFAIFDATGVSSLAHWKMLKEKLRFEKNLEARTRLLVFSGGKYLAIWLSKKSGLYPLYKRIRAKNAALAGYSK